eukprot:scaffold1476_cov264-Pinguiococcus_pyrenoidosus.AAC.1
MSPALKRTETQEQSCVGESPPHEQPIVHSPRHSLQPQKRSVKVQRRCTFAPSDQQTRHGWFRPLRPLSAALSAEMLLCSFALYNDDKKRGSRNLGAKPSDVLCAARDKGFTAKDSRQKSFTASAAVSSRSFAGFLVKC